MGNVSKYIFLAGRVAQTNFFYCVTRNMLNQVLNSCQKWVQCGCDYDEKVISLKNLYISETYGRTTSALSGWKEPNLIYLNESEIETWHFRFICLGRPLWWSYETQIYCSFVLISVMVAYQSLLGTFPKCQVPQQHHLKEPSDRLRASCVVSFLL